VDVFENFVIDCNKKENDENILVSEKEVNKNETFEKSIIDNEREKKLNILKKIKMMKEKNKNMNVLFIENRNYKNVNDYRYLFENKLLLNSLIIKNVNLPKNNVNNITIKNNELIVMYKNNKYLFLLDENYYNRYEIVDCLNDNFELNEIEIECILNKNDEFIFKSKDESIFELVDSKNSILNTLGLINGYYKNENIYKSNYPIGLSDNIFYLKIVNIDENEPLFKINNDNKEIILLKNINFPINISYLDIKFYFTPNNPILNQKYDFFYKEHSFDFCYS
jgi:hypothetical protein